MRGKGWWLLLLALFLLWPASTALADGPTIYADGGQIFVDEDVSLEPGETFAGDLGVLNGSLMIPDSAVVTGSVFVTGGRADVAGRVRGDLAVLGGDLLLDELGRVEGDVFVMNGDPQISGRVDGELSVLFGEIDLRGTAYVGGDVAVLSGRLQREAGAQVRGQALTEIPLPELPLLRQRLQELERPEIRVTPEAPQVPERPLAPSNLHRDRVGEGIGRFIGRAVSTGFLSLLFIAVGLLIVVIWPRATREVADCITAAPAQSFGLGLLTFLIAALAEALAVVLMILIILVAAALISTVILIPVGLLLIILSVLVLLPVPLVLAAATILGWVGLADVIGRRVLALLKAGDVKPLGAVLVGLLITVALAATLWIFDPLCCAWPFIILLTSVGVGAVIHTRFGKKSCRQAAAPSGPAALPPEAMDEEAGRPDGPPTPAPDATP